MLGVRPGPAGVSWRGCSGGWAWLARVMDLDCDVLIAGAGCGGVAVARSVAILGCQVVLADCSGWLGGQLTAQAVPPDEHPWVERTGITASYRRMRQAVWDSYRRDLRLREQVRRRAYLNPGEGWVSRLCAEPGVIHGVLQQLLDPYQAAGNLRLLQHYRPVRAQVDADLIGVVEFGVAARSGGRGAAGAALFADSVGIGSYRIDLHPSTAGHGYLDISAYPFQIPLGALLPVRLDNLIAGGKCLGVTHITNGCYRLHPVEWNTGEAAGAPAAYALLRHVPPRAIRARHQLLAEYQQLLTELGIQLSWPQDIRGTPR